MPAIFRLDTRTVSAPRVSVAAALVAVGLITGCGGTGEPLWGEGAPDQSDGAQSAESSGDSAGTDESEEAGEADDGAMAGRSGSGRASSGSDRSERDMAGNDMSDSDMAGAGEQAMAAGMAPPAEDSQAGDDASGRSSTSAGARAMEGLFAREGAGAAGGDRVAALRAEVSALREQVEALRPAVERFRTIEEDIRALLDRVAAMADNAEMADSGPPSGSETGSTAQRDRDPTQPPQDPALRQGRQESDAMPEQALAPTEGDAVGVHLVSYSDRAVAEEGWPQLRREYSDLLAGMQARLATVTLSDGSTFHRLIAGPVESRRAARNLCQRLEEQGQYCSPAAFIGGPA